MVSGGFSCEKSVCLVLHEPTNLVLVEEGVNFLTKVRRDDVVGNLALLCRVHHAVSSRGCLHERKHEYLWCNARMRHQASRCVTFTLFQSYPVTITQGVMLRFTDLRSFSIQLYCTEPCVQSCSVDI